MWAAATASALAFPLACAGPLSLCAVALFALAIVGPASATPTSATTAERPSNLIIQTSPRVTHPRVVSRFHERAEPKSVQDGGQIQRTANRPSRYPRQSHSRNPGSARSAQWEGTVYAAAARRPADPARGRADAAVV